MQIFIRFGLLMVLTAVLHIEAKAEELVFVSYEADRLEFSVFDKRKIVDVEIHWLINLADAANDNIGDKKSTDKYRAAANAMPIVDQIHTAFERAFTDFDDFKVVKSEVEATQILTLKLVTWGLTRTDTVTDDLRPYFRIDAELTDRKGRTLWKKKLRKIGRASLPGVEGTSVEAFEAAAQEFLDRIGEGIGYQVIYQ